MRPIKFRYPTTILSVLTTFLLIAASCAFADEILTKPDTRTQLQAAQQLLQQGALPQAEQAYRKLIKLRPQLLRAYNNLAVVYARQGKFEAARKTLTQGLRVRADVAALYDNLDAVYVELSRREYGKALRLELGQRKLALKTLPVAATKPAASAAQRPVRNLASAAKPTSISQRSEPATPAQSEELIADTVRGWARAWSAQRVALYLSFYAQDFNPPQGLQREKWEMQRRLRLRRPRWVKVSVSQIKIEALRKNHARVQFLQHYQSDSFSDVTRKELQLYKSAKGWRIEVEKSL